MLTDFLTAPSLLDVGNLVNESHPLANKLLVWWFCVPQLMGGTRLRDLVGATHGTLTSMAVSPTATSGWGRSTTRPGGWGELRFDGVGDLVSTGKQILPTTPTKFTLTAWAKLSSLAAAQIFVNWTLTSGLRIGLYYQSANTFLSFTVNNATNSATSDAAASTGVWYHVAGVYDSANATTKQVLYVNGVRQTTTANAAAATVSGYTVVLGARADASLPLTGMLDDVRIYTRALGDKEIMALYQNSRLGCPDLLNRLPIFPRVPLASAATLLPFMMQHAG
jgi:hypothetical protein